MKHITIEDFDKAVPDVAAEIAVEHMNSGVGAFLFSTAGIIFASALRKKLFLEEEKEDE